MLLGSLRVQGSENPCSDFWEPWVKVLRTLAQSSENSVWIKKKNKRFIAILAYRGIVLRGSENLCARFWELVSEVLRTLPSGPSENPPPYFWEVRPALLNDLGIQTLHLFSNSCLGCQFVVSGCGPCFPPASLPSFVPIGGNGNTCTHYSAFSYIV